MHLLGYDTRSEQVVISTVNKSLSLDCVWPRIIRFTTVLHGQIVLIFNVSPNLPALHKILKSSTTL